MQLTQENFRKSEFSRFQKEYLGPGIYHCTTKERYALITQEGFIQPNFGKIQARYPQSFANQNKYIALFSFTEENLPILPFDYWKFDNFFLKSDAVTLKLDKHFLAAKLIPESANPPNYPDHKFCIPVFEVWYPEAIPTSAITQVTIVDES
ncbi:MAG: hypothetical protein KF701_06515 [Anaerolineales bacterium]|nr:MAG: hypothetical protein KF701_06515 [Anaerolineales bacterium]